MIEGAGLDPEYLQIPRNVIDNMNISSVGCIHKLENYMDYIGNVRMSHSQIL